jgi:hypothetical protein
MENKTHHWLVLAAVTGLVCFGAHTSSAQGNFDPAQMRERMMERYREGIVVKSDEDWKKIEPLVTKVSDAQREARMGAGFGGFGGGGRGQRNRDGGGDAAGGGNAGGRNANGQGGNRNRGFGQPSAEVTELRKALDDKASEDEIKTRLTKLRDARKTKEAALEKAQEELRKALTSRQEAGAVLMGLLK